MTAGLFANLNLLFDRLKINPRDDFTLNAVELKGRSGDRSHFTILDLGALLSAKAIKQPDFECAEARNLDDSKLLRLEIGEFVSEECAIGQALPRRSAAAQSPTSNVE